jgi:hypothetical protein
MSSCNFPRGARQLMRRITESPDGPAIKKRAEECPILADSSIPDTTAYDNRYSANSGALACVSMR